MINVLIACEYSATMRDAFNALGANAWSCDFLPTEGRAGNHLQGDVRWAIEGRLDKFPMAYDIRTGHNVQYLKWDLMIAHPSCTYLTVSGLHWNKRNPERAQHTAEALDFVRYLLGVDIDHIALENPVGCISSAIRKPNQIIQPYEFGDDASKKTCWWTKNLPKLVIDPAARKAGRMVEYPPSSGKMVERWANQTDSGQNKLPPSEDRWKDRSRTYPGIAGACSSQWLQAVIGGYRDPV